MAAELEKLAQELKIQNFEIGGSLIRDLSRSLRGQKLIPKTLHENTQQSNGPLSPELLKMDAFRTRNYLLSRGVSLRTVGMLMKKGKTAAMLATVSDEDILIIRGVGKKGLEEIRSVFPRPTPPV